MNRYKNGNYIVTIMSDGTKIRMTKEDEFIPAFAENCDVKITSKCSVGCPFCYEGCTAAGEHGDLFKYNFINTLHPFTEVALNGNDLNHPQLEEFLVFLKDMKVFANITVHQKQFINNFDLLKRLCDDKLVHGLGISYSYYDQDFIEKVKQFPNAVIHTINGILSENDIMQLKGNDLKVLILGYKELQRGKDYLSSNEDSVNHNKQYLYDNLQTIVNNKYFKILSFDNLALEQLNVRRLLTDEQWEEFYMGDDGRYTFYIDMVAGKFAKNSLSTERYDIGSKTIDEMFSIIREK